MQTLRYAVLLFPGFPMMAFSALIEPLRAANLLLGETRFSWAAVGLTHDPVAASNGFSITPNHAVSDAPVVDRVVLCSGGDAERITSKGASRWLRRNVRDGAQIGAVADAAFFLAREGLLDGYRCTLHWTSQPAFQELFPQVFLERDLYVLDRDRFSSAGGIGCFDMMLALIAHDESEALANGVAEWFIHSPLRSPVDRRRMTLRIRTGIRDEFVLSAVAQMEDAVEDQIPVTELARRNAVSPDTLERAFRTELGTSPGRYYRHLRLRRSKDMLDHSALSVREVALACGYASASAFARAFRREFGTTPRRIRDRQRG